MDKYSSVFTAIWHVTRLPALYWKVSLAIVILSAYVLFPQVMLAQEFNEELEKQEYVVNATLPEVGYRDPTRTKKIIVTAYSSTPDQTDSTPFITASNTMVREFETVLLRRTLCRLAHVSASLTLILKRSMSCMTVCTLASRAVLTSGWSRAKRQFGSEHSTRPSKSGSKQERGGHIGLLFCCVNWHLLVR